MRRIMIPALGLFAACVLGSAAQAQLPSGVESATSDRQKGKDCYNGANGGKKCWLRRRSSLACYNCCAANGCTGTALTWCQDYCNGTAHDPEVSNALRTPEQIRDYVALVAGVRGDLGDPISMRDVHALDLCIARGDEASARWALVVLLDAYATGNVVTATDEEAFLLDELVGEIHQITLFEMDPAGLDPRALGLRSTARAVAAEHGILGRHDWAQTFWDTAQQVARESPAADSNLMRMFMRN